MKRRLVLLGGLVVLFLIFTMAGCQAASFQENEPSGPMGPQARSGRGEQRVLMAVVRFPDVEPGVALDRMRKKVVEDLDRYVREQSYGLAWVKADFRGWVKLPDPISEYKISPYNFQVDRRRVRKLIEDTMSGLERDVDFSSYDHMLIVPAANTQPGKGYGMLCYCGNPGMLSGVRADPAFLTLKSRGGKEFSGGVFVGAENAHLGMFAHDFFHALGGVHGRKRLVPCLYDYDRQSDASRTPTPEHHAVYLGSWDIMSEHFVKRNEPPPGICSFTKIRLGWISEGNTTFMNAGETAVAFLSPLEKPGDTLAIKIRLGKGRYYLLENRQRMASDTILPDFGLLILEVDPEVREGSGTVCIMNADPGDPRFGRATYRLEENGRNLFEDKENGVAVIPLWSEGERLGVLVTTTVNSGVALLAARKIQRMMSRVSGHAGSPRTMLIERCTAAFKNHDFAGALKFAEKGPE